MLALGHPIGHWPAAIVIPLAFFLLVAIAKSKRHVAQTTLKLCKSCGTSHPNFARFCRNCGRNLDE